MSLKRSRYIRKHSTLRPSIKTKWLFTTFLWDKTEMVDTSLSTKQQGQVEHEK